MRFPSVYEAQSFINTLKVTVAYHNHHTHNIINHHKNTFHSKTIVFPRLFWMIVFHSYQEILKEDNSPEPLNTEFGSEISSQSEFMSTNKNPHRYKGVLCDWLVMLEE